MSDVTFRDHDDLTPASIEHRCEELRAANGELEARYNYLVYHFECGGRYFWARSYLDGTSEVTVHGPFADRSSKRLIPGEADPRILAYLNRRFSSVSIFPPEAAP